MTSPVCTSESHVRSLSSVCYRPFVDTHLDCGDCDRHFVLCIALQVYCNYRLPFTSYKSSPVSRVSTCVIMSSSGRICLRGSSLFGSTVFLYQFYIQNCKRRGKHESGRTDDINIILLSRG